MVRRITPSQFNSMLRQARQKQRQAIDKLNREIRAYNQGAKRAVDQYNRAVSSHNSRVRANRQRLKSEIARLSRQPTTRYATYRISVNAVLESYVRLEQAADAGQIDESCNEILDLSEREAANNAGLMNALMGNVEVAEEAAPDSPESPLTPILQAISSELSDRWRGALFSLNPRNPDAARHFCTSSREIIAGILNSQAPDGAVVAAMPDCERTQQGTPSRRAKIRYFLHRRGMNQDELKAFVDTDISNVIELFGIFNEGTHGSAGTFNLAQLQAVRKRVEDGLVFLSRLIR
jgi:hypothetical protein